MGYTKALLAVMAINALAAPTKPAIDYTPPGGWESIDYSDDAGANLDSYPAGTGENLPYYPPGTGADGNANCPPGIIPFTSTFHITATPDQVVNGTTPTGGLPGAMGYYDLGFNSDLNLVCYNIRLVNYRGGFQSAALTATHLHEAARGQSGPPRLAFPNPEEQDNGDFLSVGCMNAPFKTGLPDMAKGLEDSGDGFSVAQIEANPAGFFADVHSGLAVPGAVRGQLA